MSYQSPYTAFIFEQADFDETSGIVTFRYSFDGKVSFQEAVQFDVTTEYDKATFERAMWLGFVIAGISYYKCYPTRRVEFAQGVLSPEQAAFFTEVYRDGLSQFVYENGLTPDDIAVFRPTVSEAPQPVDYDGTGIVSLQSGGKDSLLVASLLEQKDLPYTGWYVSQGPHHPAVLDSLGSPLRTTIRTVDVAAITQQLARGALNGHVPVTFINLSYALMDAVLHNESTILAAIGREGEEPHAFIGDYAVRHQWSKTWHAERLFSSYVGRFIAASIRVGSPLRSYSELKVARMFAHHAWERFGRVFSSCNVANYKQGQDNSQLRWCSDCPKCANSFLLFAPFIAPTELMQVFGAGLYAKPSLESTFKGLLGVDDVEKPFECVGETDELRLAYHLSQNNGYTSLPFVVPPSEFDIDQPSDGQSWAVEMLQ